MMVTTALLLWSLLALVHSVSSSLSLDNCLGYRAVNVEERPGGLSADLMLVGQPCNTYGRDIENLRLEVEYETETRLHVIIYDADENVYQVPDSVFPRPTVHHQRRNENAPELKFSYEDSPFSFAVSRLSNGEPIFNSSGSNLIFQCQYVNLRTSLPQNPNLYGIGEHSDPLRLKTTGYTRTLWNRDAYTIPAGTNLYGAHPLYFDHRGETGTHGVFLLNSNGMDVHIDQAGDGTQFLEYNLLGGVLDFYFLAGPTPKEVSMQYAEVAGLPAMVPYWGFGFHQCRYGYRDIFEVAAVVSNYSHANIPLETMWTDIDYMDQRKVFTLDERRFPLQKVRALVDFLHQRDQRYIVMVDPAVAHSDNTAFTRGMEKDVFMRRQDGSLYEGAVWPGPTVFPDWFHPSTPDYWINEFALFFDAENGVDIDALWIDMNEAANFCDWPCSDPVAFAKANNLPPDPPSARPNPSSLPGFPEVFQPGNRNKRRIKQSPRQGQGKYKYEDGKKLGIQGRDLIDPPYTIANAAGSLSNKTINTDLIHANGLAEYDTHNLYGTMMSSLSREAMLHRRPEKRPLVITRSTFAGAGARVAHWLGDNASTWEKYRTSIAQMLAFASIFQIPMVGSDVCGFTSNTTEQLCSRWAMLGAFNPFYRNHNEYGMISQEFYQWESVAEAARKAIEIRYQLLDYMYTAFYRQTRTGEPWLLPLFFVYPDEPGTFGIDLQFFYGGALLVSPVTEDGSTSVDAYFPDDLFYDWYTGLPVRGRGEVIRLSDISYTDIPLHVRGGSIIPVRAQSANTTTELRKRDFRLIIAPGLDGRAVGELYLDDGESLHQPATLEVTFRYENSRVSFDGVFTLQTGLRIESVTVFGRGGGQEVVAVDLPLSKPGGVDLG
ncbi:glycosyl hydrolases family 31-domain-containing protein [Aspergillus cavernicola]|uniref:Glycosyl hydrolases family 31-domain-containing protein n=1 Tax=Aspergillus cavernicola TaxID=176166 RepID=A0ABR4IQN2_9EURO